MAHNPNRLAFEGGQGAAPDSPYWIAALNGRAPVAAPGKAGLEFIPENDGGAGIRPRKPD